MPNPLSALAKRFLSVACFVLLLSTGAALAQTTTITYQGRLTDNGTAANGLYDLQFKLYDMLTDGTLQGSPNTVTRTGVNVTNGVFTVQLDFGASAFPGADRFLDIGVKHPADSSYIPLLPRQQLTSTPYAIQALTATNNLLKGGDTMTGQLVLSGDPVVGLGAATKQYVDSGDALKLNLSGGTMTGALNLPADGLVVGTNQLVTSGGKVGIGTATPTELLTLGPATHQLFLQQINNPGAGGHKFRVEADQALYINGYGNDLFSLSKAGYTRSKFSARSPGSAGAALTIEQDNNPGAGQSFFSDNTGSLYLGRSGGTAVTTHTTWDINGKLGLGTTTPANRLSVVGSADFTGSVGIGTTSPGSKLTVAGLIESTTGGIKFPDATTQTTAANGAAFVQKAGDTMTGTLTLPADGLVVGINQLVASGGNLGIGTAGPAVLGTSGPDLHIKGTAVGGVGYITDSTNRPTLLVEGQFPGVLIRSNGNANHGSTLSLWSYDNTDMQQWNIGGGQSGNFSIGYAKNSTNPHCGVNGYTSGCTSALTTLQILPSGNVGIGTTSPGSKLTVAGLIESTTGGIKFPDATTQTTAANGAAFVQKAGDTMTGTLTLPADGLVVGTNQLVASGGKVGIGTASATNALSVVGSADFSVSVKSPVVSSAGDLSLGAGSGAVGGSISAGAGSGSFGEGASLVLGGGNTANSNQNSNPPGGGNVLLAGGLGHGNSGGQAGSILIQGGAFGASGGGGVTISGGNGLSAGGGKVLVQSGSGATPGIIAFSIAGIEKARIDTNGNVGIGTATPTAATLDVNGTGHFTGNVSIGTLTVGGGSAIQSVLSTTAALDFPATAAQSSSDLTITLTGVVDGDTVALGVPNAAVLGNSSYSAWVSGNNTVTVRFNNYSAASLDPSSGVFRVTVIRF